MVSPTMPGGFAVRVVSVATRRPLSGQASGSASGSGSGAPEDELASPTSSDPAHAEDAGSASSAHASVPSAGPPAPPAPPAPLQPVSISPTLPVPIRAVSSPTDGKLCAQEFTEMWSALPQRERDRIEAGNLDINEAIRRWIRKREDAARARERKMRGESPMGRVPLLRRRRTSQTGLKSPRSRNGSFGTGASPRSPRGSPTASMSGMVPHVPSAEPLSASDPPSPAGFPLPATVSQRHLEYARFSGSDPSIMSCPDVPEGGSSPAGAPAKEVAFRVLQDNVDLVVCSYCAPHVFEEFLSSQLPEDHARAIRQTMRGVSNTLDDEGKRRFGDVIVGKRSDGNGEDVEDFASSGEGGRQRSFSLSARGVPASGGDAEERWALRSGGLLHGSDTLLRDFVQRHPAFAEYLSLTLVNPFVVASLEHASAVWAELHPPAQDFVLEPCFTRIVVTPTGVRIRGAADLALERNLESRYGQDEWKEAFEVRRKLQAQLSEVLVEPQNGDKQRRSRVRRALAGVTGSKAMSSELQSMEDAASRHARVGLLRLAGVDPHTSPAGLICHDLGVVRLLMQQRHPPSDRARRKSKKETLPPKGTRARKLLDALLMGLSSLEDLQRRDARGASGSLRQGSFHRRHSAPARPASMVAGQRPQKSGDSGGESDDEIRVAKGPSGEGRFETVDDGSDRDTGRRSGASTPSTPDSADWPSGMGGSLVASFCGNPMHNRSLFDSRFASSAPTGGGGFLS